MGNNLRTGRFVAVMLVLGMMACSGTSGPAGLDSDVPAQQLRAIQRAGESRDKSAIGPLVERLRHDDPAVRMMSIQALQRITGERLGYNPYSPAHEREPAVTLWVEAVRVGRFNESP